MLKAARSRSAAPVNACCSATRVTLLDRDVLFTHPPQRQVDLVSALGVALDDKGFVQVHESTRETSIPGIYAAGDLAPTVQGGQAAVLSAAAGMRAAAMINHTPTIELATTGGLKSSSAADEISGAGARPSGPPAPRARGASRRRRP